MFHFIGANTFITIIIIVVTTFRKMNEPLRKLTLFYSPNIPF